jgi:hypothetical protein
VKKELYERTELEIIKFYTEDVIMTSGQIELEEDETPFMPNR